MKGRWLWIVIAANLVALVGLAFWHPHLMISPGPLIPGHATLTTDCYACHAPLRGASTERCITCHTVADIGLRTTKGQAITVAQAVRATPMKMSFHQELTEQDCMACHSDHAGPKLTQRDRRPFSHALLRVATRERCASCHAAPTDDRHRKLNPAMGCVTCHTADGWKPAHFDHAALTKVELDRCESCHKPPGDSLHRPIKGNCAQCHSTQAWEPATFEHDKLFVLDRDHNASCETCHKNPADYRQYTCYGCHEHTLANVREEHEEEGIRNFDNCVKCHRSADEEPSGEGRGEEKDGERD
ncbi:class III cytochrome C family protein [Hydrogenophaga aromaticivorans]|uniref:multiheme c-type cytochrome n=1 Tax=Hydrogenophaga aromaticivorans TaxID=2610898 RepID=UPI001B36EC56|nr:multiheme c-type cytochrome [Hydrogenophaga aromaticivorans]MBQ0920073.1 class III cytochrome C family protein [Hydrogenophaga aromaticivorans]